jgi:hypothetical protein
MTMLATVTRNEFVLSIADRRTTIQQGGRFVPVDEHFNKHVFFCIEDDRAILFKGVATFTGLAEWEARTGGKTTTDKLIASALRQAAILKAPPGVALHLLAVRLAEERRFIESTVRGTFPGFTVLIAGYFSVWREPYLALVTDSQESAPSWDEDSSQLEVPAPAPFRIHTAMRCRPSYYLAGYTGAISSRFHQQIQKTLSAPSLRAYDAARAITGELRRAASRTECIGARASAVLVPADGWQDTALWQASNERVRCFMPLSVFPDGSTFDANEAEFNFEGTIATLPRHGLLFEHLINGHVGKRTFRRAKRRRGQTVAPTLFKCLTANLYGKTFDELDAEAIEELEARALREAWPPKRAG